MGGGGSGGRGMWMAGEFRVTFRVKNDGTQPGDSFLIMGSNELGNWRPGTGLKMTTTGSTFPYWTGSVDIPSEGSLEYK